MQDEMGLNWLDYGARFYDAVLGRWHAIDPFAEVYNAITPYHYAANNPINIIDVKGKFLKDKDGNIIANPTGNEIKRSSEVTAVNGKEYAYISTYNEVTVYTEEAGTPINILQHVSTVVSEKNSDGSFSPVQDSPLGLESNCHGYAYAGKDFTIEDVDITIDGKSSSLVNLILKEDNYTQTNESDATNFTLTTDKSTDVPHSGKVNSDGTFSADQGPYKPTEHVDFETAKGVVAIEGMKTTFYKKEDTKTRDIKPNTEKAPIKGYFGEK